MPHRRLANTISSVLRTLTTARDAKIKYPGQQLITDAQWAKLDPNANPPSFLTMFEKEAGDVSVALAKQAPLTDLFNKGLARLTLFVSHFHQVYDFGVLRGDFTAGGHAYYGRDVSATTLPDLSSITAVLEAAKKVGEGEAKRATGEGAKYIAMAMPSAAQVTAVYSEVLAEYNASQQAQAFTDLQQNELAVYYPDAQKLAVAICNTVEFMLTDEEKFPGLDDAGRRNIAVRWGLVYLSDNGTVIPTPPPTPTPTPPANP